MNFHSSNYIKPLIFMVFIGHILIEITSKGFSLNNIYFCSKIINENVTFFKTSSPKPPNNAPSIPISEPKSTNGKPKKSKKWACFLTVHDYETRIKPYFQPRDLRLCSCMFNIDPFDIDETNVLVIGSKKKVGSELIKLLKANQIKYGRIKNRYHVNMTNHNMTDLLTLLNFKTVIDLTNDLNLNSIFNQLFSPKKIFLIRTKPSNLNDKKEEQYSGVTVLTDKIFNPYFYPNALHTRENGDLNYYIFDKYVRDKIVKDPIDKTKSSYDKDVKYSSAKEVASVIFDIIQKKKSESNLIDLRKSSQKAKEIVYNLKSGSNDNFTFSVSDIIQHYKSIVESCIITPKNDYIYTSHVTIVSDTTGVINRYKAACFLVNEALRSFYGMTSIEFICVTNIQPNEYEAKFGWLSDLTEFKKHHILMSIPRNLMEVILKTYRIYYFPEYFLRNIGLRRARGRYLLSGSSDVIMPPHFFLGLQKHLFSKNYLLRTIRNKIREQSLTQRMNSKSSHDSIYSFKNLYFKYIKNNFFRNKIVNTEYYRNCERPCNPRNRDCGDFQGFHREFWYKMNAYYNDYENYNVDSLLSYHLLGMFSPIIYKLMYGELHIYHRPQSNKTPGLPFSIYCGPVSIKNGIFKGKYNGTVDWGYINVSIPTRYSFSV